MCLYRNVFEFETQIGEQIRENNVGIESYLASQFMKKYKRTYKVLKDSNGDPLMIEVPHGNAKVSKFNIRFSELQRNMARMAQRSAKRLLKALKSKD